MENPFQHTRPVAAADLCGREPELRRIAGSLDAGTRWTVGPPGWGVSSLLGALAGNLSAGRTVVRIDLWPGLQRDAVLRELRSGPDPDPEPGGGAGDADPAGPSGRGDRDAGAPDGSPPVLLVEGGGAAVSEWSPALLDAIHDAWRGGAVVWGVDRQGKRPGGAGEPGGGGPWEPGKGRHLRLGPVPAGAWLPYVLERFLETRRWIANEHVEAAVARTGGHPRHTQHLFGLLWEGCEAGDGVQDADLDRTFRTLVRRVGQAFGLLWGELTPNQRRVLRGLALEGADARPYSSSFVRSHHLASPSSAQRALEALEERGLVDRAGGGHPVRDPLLPPWIRMREADAGRKVSAPDAG